MFAPPCCTSFPWPRAAVYSRSWAVDSMNARILLRVNTPTLAKTPSSIVLGSGILATRKPMQLQPNGSTKKNRSDDRNPSAAKDQPPPRTP